jgi:DNA-binding LacI/PurR family transcriptional regulator
MTAPALTTDDQSIDATIATAAEFLLAQLGKPLPARPVVRTIAPRLIVRGSTGPARG